MELLQLAKQRCTTRGFTGEAIPKEDLDYILEAGRVAPTACNRQPQRIMVIQEPENIEKVRKAYNTFDAPCVLVISRDRRDELVRPFDGKCSGDLDMGIVCDHMMLAARERSIGSVMVGLFDPAIIRAAFGVPDYIDIAALLLLGYPARGFLPRNRHDVERLPLEQTVMYEGYRE